MAAIYIPDTVAAFLSGQTTPSGRVDMQKRLSVRHPWQTQAIACDVTGAYSLTSAPSVTGARVVADYSGRYIICHGIDLLQTLDFLDLPLYGDVHLQGAVSLESLAIANTYFESANCTGCCFLSGVSAANSNLVNGLQLVGCESLVSLDVSYSLLSALDLSDTPILKYVSIQGSELNAAACTALLIQCAANADAGDLHDGQFFYDVTQTPTSEADQAVTFLTSTKGWTVGTPPE